MGRLKRSKSNGELRGGYTTGACAAAAARAAVKMLISQKPFDEIEIQLPNREFSTFRLNRLVNNNRQEETISYEVSDGVTAGVIKDAGDDPDCTHGLEILCNAYWKGGPGIRLKGGKGVATVTLPGLELSVGEPAINPVPRANILEMAELEWLKADPQLRQSIGLELVISVPDGKKAAEQTINERLGLLGGISILGTRGTVKPFSTSAFAASVRQSVQIAQANSCQHVVLTTGGRSEKAAMALMPKLADTAFIQAGDFIGVGLRAAKRYGIKHVTVVAMIGKMGKLVSGKMMTHVSGHAIDFQWLSEMAQQEQIPLEVCNQITSANTGRHVLEMVRDLDSRRFMHRLCCEAQKQAMQYTAEALEIDVQLIDFNGKLLGSFPATNLTDNR